MSKTYVVAAGKSVNVNDRSFKGLRAHFEQGETLPELSDKTIASLLKKGVIKQRGGEVEKDPDTVPNLNEDGTASKVPAVAATRFTMDPKKLAGKSVEELNVMLREIDKDAPTFKTAPEAVAELSKDFRDPTPVISKTGPPPKPQK